KADHPDQRIILVGESLGATPCIRLAAEHGDLVDAIIISGPAVEVNPLMLFHPRSILAGLRGILIDPKFNIKLSFFVEDLVSDDPNIVKEMMDDPLIRKKLSLLDLLKTDAFVSKNLKFASNVKPELPILILQGSKDKCVIPQRVVKLCGKIKSDDQTLRWMDHLSHLLLETKYLKPATIAAMVSFLESHATERTEELEQIHGELKLLGAGEL
ncbi:MAG: lysophospholipase, partial [Cyanobacteria bacterium]|nr:lysophospholipase [Cyanobacteriota bacterium]